MGPITDSCMRAYLPVWLPLALIALHILSSIVLNVVADCCAVDCLACHMVSWDSLRSAPHSTHTLPSWLSRASGQLACLDSVSLGTQESTTSRTLLDKNGFVTFVLTSVMKWVWMVNQFYQIIIYNFVHKIVKWDWSKHYELVSDYGVDIASAVYISVL